MLGANPIPSYQYLGAGSDVSKLDPFSLIEFDAFSALPVFNHTYKEKHSFLTSKHVIHNSRYSNHDIYI